MHSLRKDIPEGAHFRDMPVRIGYGRVLSIPELDEWYFTLRLFGWRLFVARGLYDRHHYGYRDWLQRDRQCTPSS
jgi:hypothetical protein